MMSSPSSTRLSAARVRVPERLKIGLLTDAFLPLSNGVTHSVAALARLLLQSGHEPHIFTFAPASELKFSPESLLDDPPHLLRVPPRGGEEAIDGVPIHYAPALPILETGYYFGVRYPMWMRSLLHEMDVLHVHHPFISGRLARRLRLDEQPIVFTNHTRYDIYTHYFQSAVPRQMQSLTQPLTSPETLGRRFALRAARFANICDAVIAPSPSMCDVLASWGVRAPVRVIPNGVDLSRFLDTSSTRKTENVLNKAHNSSHEQSSHEHERAQWRKRWGIALDAPLAIYLGRIAPEKNGRVLLEAFALAQRTNIKFRLVVVGNGPSIEEWKEWARELGMEKAVHFAGALAVREVASALSAADVFVSASVSEVHPLTFIEAMASGLPCLGTPSPGVQDSIIDGVNGWLAAPEPLAFSVVLRAVLSDEAERRKRGARAQKDSRAYSVEANAAQVLKLYNEVVEARMKAASSQKF